MLEGTEEDRRRQAKEQLVSANKRHVQWLRRAATPVRKAAAWRPRQRYRVAAQRWLAQADNQLRLGTSFGGLTYIWYRADAPQWRTSEWRTWPGASTALDQGSDGLCATMALLYNESIQSNLIVWYEWSHGAENDMMGCYTEI